MTRGFESYFGIAFTKIIRLNKVNSLRPYASGDNSAYILNENIGIFIKYSAKRLSPWTFTFLKDHQDKIQRIADQYSKVFLLLVCNDDGVVCLSFLELKKVLDDKYQESEWIRVSRKKRESYAVSGSNGKLKFKVGPGDFPKKIFNDN